MNRLVLPCILSGLVAACVPAGSSQPASTQPAELWMSTPTEATAPISEPVSGTYLPSDFVASEILGRPTDTSVSVNVVPARAMEVSYEYGTTPGEYSARTASQTAAAGAPLETLIAGLEPNTHYYFRIRYDGAAGPERSFTTQRAPGSSFTFTIDADPHHGDPRFNGDLYSVALSGALADHPDFHINLGDTFMTEKLGAQTAAEVEATLAEMRPYFGLLAADTPLFLVNGNHEGELGWLLTRSPGSLPLWSARTRQAYFPSPSPGGFYSGSTTIDPQLGAPRDGYYAWSWGDSQFIVLDPFWYTASKPRPDDPEGHWGLTLGKDQYDWLRSALEASRAKHKFVFIHHLVGGAREARGGIEAAPYFEWGGLNADGSYGFDEYRAGWYKPIHDLLVEAGVTAVFHGHDHLFARQILDGIVYQEVPQASYAGGDVAGRAAEAGYLQGEVLGGSGYLRVTVGPDLVAVDYVLARLPQDEGPDRRNGQVAYSYTIP